MHDLLVDQARRKGAQKRGAGEVPAAIDESAESGDQPLARNAEATPEKSFER